MPANLSPEYKAAADAYRKARDPQERLEHLREMLSVIPKHKGTDHLQADLKRRIKELDEELAGPKRGGARSGPALVIRPEGAAQVALVGAPNSGKSLLHDRLTGSGAKSGPYPVHHAVSGARHAALGGRALPARGPARRSRRSIRCRGSRARCRAADACLLVVDLADPGLPAARGRGAGGTRPPQDDAW